MVDLLAGVGQTFPPVAVLAIAVPLIGFGAWPTVVALFLYGLLPIIENAIAGLEGVPQAVREAADGMGLTPWQRLRTVELPLAAPVILAGIRVSVTIAIGTATIGSTVGALDPGHADIRWPRREQAALRHRGRRARRLIRDPDRHAVRPPRPLAAAQHARMIAAAYFVAGAIVRAASAVMISERPRKTMLIPTRRPIAQAAELGQPSQIR